MTSSKPHHNKDSPYSEAIRVRLGALLRARRRFLGMSQRDLSGRGGPGEQAVIAHEAGKFNDLRADTERKFEEALELEAGSLRKVLQGHATELSTRPGSPRAAGAAADTAPQGSPEDVLRQLQRLATEVFVNASQAVRVAEGNPDPMTLLLHLRAMQGASAEMLTMAGQAGEGQLELDALTRRLDALRLPMTDGKDNGDE